MQNQTESARSFPIQYAFVLIIYIMIRGVLMMFFHRLLKHNIIKTMNVDVLFDPID
jgi:hypothetical protein